MSVEQYLLILCMTAVSFVYLQLFARIILSGIVSDLKGLVTLRSCSIVVYCTYFRINCSPWSSPSCESHHSENFKNEYKGYLRVLAFPEQSPIASDFLFKFIKLSDTYHESFMSLRVIMQNPGHCQSQSQRRLLSDNVGHQVLPTK